MKLDDLNLFRQVVEHGSYTATSRATRIPVATITRRIQALEDAIDLRLLNRHARKLTLTEAGQRFYQECGPLLKQISASAVELGEECRGAAGRLRISTPANLTKRMLMPMFEKFMKTYPDIHLDLSMTNRADELDPTEWDMIFRVGPQRDSNLIARKLTEVKDILVASPEYLQNSSASLQHAEDLANHSLLKGLPLTHWSLVNNHGETVVNKAKGRLEASDLNVVRHACSAGLGIGLVPDVMVTHHVAEGNLVRVLPEWAANPRDIFVLYNHKDHIPEKTRLLIDFIRDYFA
ncbi:cyn operon transcriptional activator [Vibrio ishigakensis]|uniref:Cyn operon transcriptional activator n=1 Tax=Vibrio ishigakensis TaxID=1481914 RepID=A0A0B8PAF0_9VIBR|nr:LysR family transcriptional regulator [Vibrio ishigakensis]GAM54777.1 cyn operon transcriptional activator [Vibrio ishigakensis]GAM61562.1 cyn operon transcriptional activator [Vibrio ishigakensis]GAM69286.1 cyn operon transcriptional activator [Vibrio sp. JCM 19236]